MKKETKSKPKKNSNTTSKIIIAKILLILLIVIAIILTYLKFFGPNQNLEEHPLDENRNQIDTKIELLESITTIMNDSSMVEEYKDKKVNIWANVNSNNNSIILNYETSSIIQFELDYREPNLEISINKEEELVFSEMYKILILANQERLENTITNTEYIDEFLKGNNSIDGYTREVTGDTIRYTMDITKKINITGISTQEAIETTTETSSIEGSE